MTTTLINLANIFVNGPTITESNFHLVDKINFKIWLFRNLNKMSDKTIIEANEYLNPKTDHYKQRRLIANCTKAFF